MLEQRIRASPGFADRSPSYCGLLNPTAGPAAPTSGRSVDNSRPNWNVRVREHSLGGAFGRCLVFEGVSGPWIMQDITVNWRAWAVDCDSPPPYRCQSRFIELFRVRDGSGSPTVKNEIGSTSRRGPGIHIQSDPEDPDSTRQDDSGRYILRGIDRCSWE